MPIELGSHQLEAIEKLKNGSILQGGVGTGKTRTALAYYYLKVCKGSLPINGQGEFRIPKTLLPLYVITTARKRDTKDWEKEAASFGLSGDPENSILPMTVDSWNNITKYKNVKGAFFIFDEQRVIGNGVWVESFLKITKGNQWILLSATPGDTWIDYIPVFIANGFYKHRTEFIDRHVVYRYPLKYKRVSRYLETKRLERLRNDILVPMYYEKHTVPHHLTITASYDKSLYRIVLKDRWNPYEEKPIKDVSMYCILQRRVVNSDPSRIDILNRIMQSHPKAIVFYNFNYELDILHAYAKKARIPCTEWNGHRHELIPQGDRWLYLVQYAAGAEGWNCIETDTLIFYSLNYSYKVNKQSEGRIDRLNTPFTDLYYYHIRSAAPIDLMIMKSLNEKKDFNESRAFKSFKPAPSREKHGI